ncbi:MAG: hypothetical protein ACOYIR_05550 [Christensenellales bacterium]
MRQSKTASPKKRNRKWPLALGITLAVIILALAAIQRRRTPLAAGSIRSAVAKTGNLSITVVGTGNLEYDDAQDIKIPTGITIDEVLVESGDAVTAGDTLATIDPLSLKREIGSVRSRIDALDRSINSAKDRKETETVKSHVSGRVKGIYAKKGDDALKVYDEHGALLLLSLDGKMAVDFSTTAALSVGDRVNVLLENGSVKEGTVEKALGGNCTITLTDNGPRLDEPVTIHSKNGDVLGTGRLYVHQPIRIVATDGRVRTVHVSENEKISAGKTLVTLQDLSISLEYQQLLADRAELMEKLDHLLNLSRSNALIADFGGVIQSVNIEEGQSTGETTTASGGNTPGSFASATTGGSLAAPASTQTAAGGSEEHMVTALTAAPAESVLLSVQVDELDILSIQVGMEAEITFDAIPDRVFGGTIIQIADAATTTGGVAKFFVKVRVQKDDAMRIGMNATATILVEEKQNILLLPIVALQESGGRVYVYTQKNADGELLGEVDVVTGSSDGEHVEILDGLAEGSEVYYRAASGEILMNFGPGRTFRSGSPFGTRQE